MERGQAPWPNSKDAYVDRLQMLQMKDPRHRWFYLLPGSPPPSWSCGAPPAKPGPRASLARERFSLLSSVRAPRLFRRKPRWPKRFVNGGKRLRNVVFEMSQRGRLVATPVLLNRPSTRILKMLESSHHRHSNNQFVRLHKYYYIENAPAQLCD